VANVGWWDLPEGPFLGCLAWEELTQGLGRQVFVREFVPACAGQMLAAWECVERVGEDGRWVFGRPKLELWALRSASGSVFGLFGLGGANARSWWSSICAGICPSLSGTNVSCLGVCGKGG